MPLSMTRIHMRISIDGDFDLSGAGVLGEDCWSVDAECREEDRSRLIMER